MMAAYPPGQNMHPGMQPGHPGMAPNQVMGQPMQMPPHVTQAGMMAMPGGAAAMQAGMVGHPGMQMGRGMGAPGQAMTHPQAQQMMMQQQQQAGQNNSPQYTAALEFQRKMVAQRMMQAQAMGMSPQQMQQMMQQNPAAFQNNQVQLPAHMLIQQQQLRQQQAQQAQNQAAQQAQAQQQQLAMQHANSQHSNPGQPSNQPQPGQNQAQPAQPNQGQAAQSQGQMRQVSQPQQPPQSQAPAQPSQQAQQAQQNAQNQQNQQTQAQANQAQPGQNAQQAQAQQAGQGASAQQLAIMNQRRQALLQQQIRGGPQQTALAGQYLLRFMLFSDHLAGFTQQTGTDISKWNAFVDRYFAPESRFVLQPYEGKSRQIELLRATLPRFFWMYFETGAKSLRLHTESAHEAAQPDGRCRVTFSNASLTVSYPNGAKVEQSGPMSVLYAAGSDLIEGLEFHIINHEEMVARTEIEKVLANQSPTMSNAKSPKMTKKNAAKGQKMQNELSINSFPRAPPGSYGMAFRMWQFLEITETITIMQDLMYFSQENSLRPNDAVEALATQYQNQPEGSVTSNPQMLANAQMTNGGTPRMMKTGMPGHAGFVNSSPGMANMSLPQANGVMNGSPHFGNTQIPGIPGQMNSSPAMSHMAPPMMPQHSQQGTNSTAASADTSPQVNNKRRRSTVKEEDGGGGEGKVKPSPRMGKKAKPS